MSAKPAFLQLSQHVNARLHRAGNLGEAHTGPAQQMGNIRCQKSLEGSLGPRRHHLPCSSWKEQRNPRSGRQIPAGPALGRRMILLNWCLAQIRPVAESVVSPTCSLPLHLPLPDQSAELQALSLPLHASDHLSQEELLLDFP